MVEEDKKSNIGFDPVRQGTLARRKRWSRWTPSDILVKGGHMALADLFTLIEVFSIFCVEFSERDYLTVAPRVPFFLLSH